MLAAKDCKPLGRLRAQRRRAPPQGGAARCGAALTSSPFWILRLELMMILCPRSKVTTSATQLGAHEWLMYLQAAVSETTYCKTLEEAFLKNLSAHRENVF